jgi:RNA polymerase sigma factor (sigma-70 family)
MMDEADAFAALYARESEAVLTFLVRRTFDAETALELTAETFAVALTSWARLRRLPPRKARAWLFTVAQRLYSRYLRKARVERRAIERLGIQVPVVHEDDLAAIEARAELHELREALRPALARLNNGQQQALQLRVVEERPYDDVARRLGVSEQTARARVSRGLRTLMTALQPQIDAWKEVP